MKELSAERKALAIQGSKIFERAHRVVSNPTEYPHEDPRAAEIILDRGVGQNLRAADPELAEAISLGLYHYQDMEITLLNEDSEDPGNPISLN